MTSIDCWSEIRNLKGRVLKTLDRRKPFQVVVITEHTVIVLPLETGNERPIPRAGIENAFRHPVVTGRLTLAELEKEYTPRNPVYSAAMLAEFPGQTTIKEPITIWKDLFIKTAVEKPWFRKLLVDVMKDLG